MDAHNFTVWLAGYARLLGDTPPTPQQWKLIREQLADASKTPAVKPRGFVISRKKIKGAWVAADGATVVETDALRYLKQPGSGSIAAKAGGQLH